MTVKLELNQFIIEDAPVEITGFSSLEIDQITMEDEPDPNETGPLEPDTTAEPIAKLGDVFALGSHLIACGS